jgi:two-component system, chemotaxis family, CheB/CheR fusion protein
MFATDLDKQAIDHARQGVFPANIAADLSPERLRRFFNKDDHGYLIKKEIRQQIVFAQHHVLGDPPFTKLDLLCCRNLLIYFKADWQKKLLVTFHYALRPGGVLFLGPAETIGGLSDLYAPIDHRWKLFRSKEPDEGPRPMATVPGHRLRPEPPLAPPAPRTPPAPRSDVAEVAQRLLLDTFVPPSVVITAQGDIVYVVGHTGKYLEPAAGKMNLNVFAMAREGLREELGLAIRNALNSRAGITVHGLRLKSPGSAPVINLTVKPLNTDTSGKLLLVVFEEIEPSSGAERKPALSVRSGRLAKTLETELRQTKAHLQSTVEQMEAADEELKAANEELQSNNEELQSTNEELTTSKEELQSLNEEMTTVNSELQTKLDQLSQVNNDMRNLLNGIDTAIIFADNELRIKRFTQQATRIVNLIPTDVGRPLNDLAANLRHERLADDAAEVLRTLMVKEKQVQTSDDGWHLMRILPYRTTDNVIDGVVITFNDVTPLKKLEASLQEARLFAESIIATVREPLLVLDAELHIVSASRAFYETFRVTPDQTERRLLYEVGNRQWDIPELKRLLHDILPRQVEMRNFRVEHDFPGLGHRVMLLNARQVYAPEERPPLILLVMEDVTDAPRPPAEKHK